MIDFGRNRTKEDVFLLKACLSFAGEWNLGVPAVQMEIRRSVSTSNAGDKVIKRLEGRGELTNTLGNSIQIRCVVDNKPQPRHLRIAGESDLEGSSYYWAWSH